MMQGEGLDVQLKRLNQQERRQKLQSALALHQQGKIEDARSLYEAVLLLDPEDFDALHLSGVIAYQQKRLADAEVFFTKALRINSGSASVYSNYGLVLKDLSRLDEALACYDKALALEPHFADAHSNRAVVLSQMGRSSESKVSLVAASSHKNISKRGQDMDLGGQPGTRNLDLGCGKTPKNPFNAEVVFGIDIRDDIEARIYNADLAIEPIPFEDEFFDSVSAFDFIEHIPRIIYNPGRRFCFVELMNEIYRVLKPGGLLYSFTPAFPAPAAWRDPTHVNIITAETFPFYFDDKYRLAAMYGFNGCFRIEEQQWHPNKIHLISVMRKRPPTTESAST